jgi:ABC-type ATPase involved in cell division
LYFWLVNLELEKLAFKNDHSEIKPASGSIIVDDFDLTDKIFSKIELRRKIGIIFQDFRFFR